ncbi:unnamed protein product [Prorocentrum cordatum]|uniref:Uncharacterized protein n=1 Tax=Prorocentrum cordatum TaxID=2364126 RepID=A0ABN9XJQ6_9DINO|nr:unnamed protein product [Polarella glacialis]
MPSSGRPMTCSSASAAQRTSSTRPIALTGPRSPPPPMEATRRAPRSSRPVRGGCGPARRGDGALYWAGQCLNHLGDPRKLYGGTLGRRFACRFDSTSATAEQRVASVHAALRDSMGRVAAARIAAPPAKPAQAPAAIMI